MKPHDYQEFMTLVQELQNAWEKKSTFQYMIALQKLDLHFKQHIDLALAERQITYVYDLKKNGVDKQIMEMEKKLEHMHSLREQAMIECSLLIREKGRLSKLQQEVMTSEKHNNP